MTTASGDQSILNYIIPEGVDAISTLLATAAIASILFQVVYLIVPDRLKQLIEKFDLKHKPQYDESIKNGVMPSYGNQFTTFIGGFFVALVALLILQDQTSYKPESLGNSRTEAVQAQTELDFPELHV